MINGKIKDKCKCRRQTKNVNTKLQMLKLKWYVIAKIKFKRKMSTPNWNEMQTEMSTLIKHVNSYETKIKYNRRQTLTQANKE